jgi:hypothetical protein
MGRGRSESRTEKKGEKQQEREERDCDCLVDIYSHPGLLLQLEQSLQALMDFTHHYSLE